MRCSVVLRGIFQIAGSLMRAALGLVELAFDLKARLSSEAADCILHRALGLFRGALDMFLIPALSFWFRS